MSHWYSRSGLGPKTHVLTSRSAIEGRWVPTNAPTQNPLPPLDPEARKTVSYRIVKTTVSSKGQIVLPAELRERDRIEPGEEFEVERIDRGDYRLVRRTPVPNEGLVDWLLACPEKGFFVPIESESTDTL